MNKVAIVTGASRGIGKAIAIKLVNDEYSVVGVYIQNDKLAEEIQKEYKNISLSVNPCV